MEVLNLRLPLVRPGKEALDNSGITQSKIFVLQDLVNLNLGSQPQQKMDIPVAFKFVDFGTVYSVLILGTNLSFDFQCFNSLACCIQCIAQKPTEHKHNYLFLTSCLTCHAYKKKKQVELHLYTLEERSAQLDLRIPTAGACHRCSVGAVMKECTVLMTKWVRNQELQWWQVLAPICW